MIVTNGKKVWQACGCEAVYVTCDYMMRYVTGFVAENGFVIVDKDGTTLFTDMRYIEEAEKLCAGTEVTPTLYKRGEALERLAKYKTVGISFSQTSHAQYETLAKAGINLVDVDEQLASLMLVKNSWELDNIAKASEIAEEAFLKLLPQIKEGMTEIEVSALLEYNMRVLGAQGFSFDTIVAFGDSAAVPHHETGTRKLVFGDEVLIDFGCKVNGYCSDITRTFLLGDDGKHEAFKKAYNAVLTAHELVKERVVSGMSCGDADAVARDYLTAQGYGELFTHSLGHGIGLNVHEYPHVRKNCEEILTDGMVFSDEPGVYVAGEFGIRIEDTVTLKDGKVYSFMSKTDKNLIIL